jgi:hypothetical protein
VRQSKSLKKRGPRRSSDLGLGKGKGKKRKLKIAFTFGSDYYFLNFTKKIKNSI